MTDSMSQTRSVLRKELNLYSLSPKLADESPERQLKLKRLQALITATWLAPPKALGHEDEFMFHKTPLNNAPPCSVGERGSNGMDYPHLYSSLHSSLSDPGLQARKGICSSASGPLPLTSPYESKYVNVQFSVGSGDKDLATKSGIPDHVAIRAGHLSPCQTSPALSSTRVDTARIQQQSSRTTYAFRLFSRPRLSHRDVPREVDGTLVDIGSPSPEDVQPGFMVPTRPTCYYFWGDTSPEQRGQFEEVAVTGAEILSRAKQPWPGCALPWRVVSLNVGKLKRPVEGEKSRSLLSDPHRPRPGKKRRIMLRKKASVVNQLRDIQSTIVVDKELLTKEKKARKYQAQKWRRAQKQAEKLAEL